MAESIVVFLFCLTFLLVVGYFFVVTRGALIAHAFVPRRADRYHVYWVYSHMGLIRFSDKKPWVAAVLLFQYDRLVNKCVNEIKRVCFKGQSVLMTSCAFGDVMPKVVRAFVEAGASRICITDIIANELIHADDKLVEFRGKVEFKEADATSMPQQDGTVDFNFIFFLFHELPDQSKDLALREAARIVALNGILVIAEFHRPTSRFFRLLGRIYFTVFEPFALSLWERYDPAQSLERMGNWEVNRSLFFFGNFQVVVAKKVGKSTD